VTTAEIEDRPSRGHKKRARTRRQLILAGAQVLAEKGDALTISDVVARAEVSNGTFYNYFSDREELIESLAEHSLLSLAAQSARDTEEEDPAMRFACATSRVLYRALEDPTWGRVILRLTDHRRSAPRELHRYLREDLATGFEQGRFDYGPDEITLDWITGLIVMSIRRIVRGRASSDHVERVLERALVTLGIDRDEAVEIVARAVADHEARPGAPASPSPVDRAEPG